jgi:tetratricopeptide (TPR) repeat protein
VQGNQSRAAAGELPPGVAVGSEVVLKTPGTPLYDVGHWVPSQDHLTFVVERAQGDRLLVVSRDKTVRGWLPEEQVVPLDDADDYFTQVLERDRRNIDAYWMRARLRLYRNDPDRALVDLAYALHRHPDEARLYVTRALALLKKGEFGLAIADCDQAIQLDHRSAKTYVIRASAWLAQKNYEKCQSDLDAALRLDSVSPTAATFNVSYRPTPISADDEPGREKVRDDGAQTGQRAPISPEDLVTRGNVHLAREEYDDALSDFGEALRLDRDYAPAYAARAEVWARKHYRERELTDITEAIKRAPTSTVYRLARAQSWSAQGRHDAAMDDFNAALGMEPQNPALWVARGVELRRDLKLAEAIADFTQAIQLDVNYTPAYVNRGQAWRQRREFARAVQEFSDLARRVPDNAVAHMSLARILATCTDPAVRSGRWAVDESTRACELTNWQDADCLDTLAAACAENDDFPNAIKWQTRAISLLRQRTTRTVLQRALDYGGMRGVGFEDRLAFYKSRKPTRE